MSTMLYHNLQKFTDTYFRFDENEPLYKNDLDFVDKKSKKLKITY